MKTLSTPKQLLIIVYSIIAIVFGLLLSREHNTFEFLIPITLINMFTFYIISYLENTINWKGLCLYFAALFISFAVLLSVPYPSYVDEIRLLCMDCLSVMYTIVGVLAGGIARYKVERYERLKEGEEDEQDIET